MLTLPRKRRCELHYYNGSKHNAQLLQVHGVLRCLYKVLLHADDDDAVFYAETAHVAANLINNTAEELDSVHIGPLIEA